MANRRKPPTDPPSSTELLISKITEDLRSVARAQTGTPDPLKTPAEPREPTPTDILQLMPADDLQAYKSRDVPTPQRDAIFEFYKAQWKEGERDRLCQEQERTRVGSADGGAGSTPLRETPKQHHSDKGIDKKRARAGSGNDPKPKYPHGLPFPNLTDAQLRRERMWRDIRATGKADPEDIAEEEAEEERYQRKLAEARERKRKQVEAEFAKQGKPETVHREAQSGIQALQAEVDRAGKVMGKASELLRRKTPKPPDNKLPSSPEDYKIVAWAKRNPFWLAAAAFMVWQLPLGIAQLWPVFVRNKTIPEWVAEKRWPGMTSEVYGWLSVIFFVALVIVATIVTLVRKRDKN